MMSMAKTTVSIAYSMMSSNFEACFFGIVFVFMGLLV